MASKKNDGSLSKRGIAATVPDDEIGVVLTDLAIRLRQLCEKYREEVCFLNQLCARLEESNAALKVYIGELEGKTSAISEG